MMLESVNLDVYLMLSKSERTFVSVIPLGSDGSVTFQFPFARNNFLFLSEFFLRPRPVPEWPSR